MLNLCALHLAPHGGAFTANFSKGSDEDELSDHTAPPFIFSSSSKALLTQLPLHFQNAMLNTVRLMFGNSASESHYLF